ncbi:MAG: lysylphosphatidylglycerol synthase transmembrane domain-containing protein [Bacteroidales bacterium]|nr:lysylphosphatidylglycerol synthase transmembrane domain-containing protein [Bacteroidales bacterium]
MNKKVKNTLNIILFLGIAAVLLYFAFKGVDTDSLINGFRSANYTWVIAALILGLSSHIVRALRWRLLIETLGYKPSFANTFGALSIGYSANLIFPRLGEVTRCGSLRKTDKIPFESLLGTVLVERAFDVLMMLILVIAVFFLRIDFFGEFIYSKALLPIWEKIITLLSNSPLFIAIALLALAGLAVMIKRKAFGQKFHLKLVSLWRGLIDGLKSAFTMKKRWAFLGYTLLLWFLYWLMTWMLVFATQATSGLSAIDGFFLLVVGTLGMAAPVQGGFGAFHVIIAMALGIYGISWEDGLVYAVISHESQTLLIVILGLVFAVYFFLKSHKKNVLV